MKNLFGAGATAFLTCLDMAVKSEVEKWPDEEPTAHSPPTAGP